MSKIDATGVNQPTSPRRATGMSGLFPEPVLAALRAAPDQPAIEWGGVTVSRGELLMMVRRIAGGMSEVGLRRGMGVGMLLPLTPQAYAAHLAAYALGCRVAAARPAWAPELLEFALKRLDIAVAVTEQVLIELLDSEPIDVSPPLARPEDPARLIFTSGSTGLPKACTHSYRAVSMAYQTEHWPESLTRLETHFGRCLLHQSLAAPVMFTYLGRCLVAGGMAVFPEGPTGPELDLAKAIEQLRPTATMMHPGRLYEILQSDADLSSLEALMLGGSPASPTLLRAAMDRLGPVVWQGYGQGEAGIISMLTPEQIAEGHDDTVGGLVPDVELELRDGVIHVRSPHMMDGYWDDIETTQGVLRDGWLNTQDVGFLDEDGLLHLVGRSRDVIMVNAEVCYAGAIEQVLASHPLVAQAFAVGAPDPMTGEAIHAFIMLSGDEKPAEEELRDLVRRRLSANSQPKTITAISEVPLTAAGKPDKHSLLGGALATGTGQRRSGTTRQR